MPTTTMQIRTRRRRGRKISRRRPRRQSLSRRRSKSRSGGKLVGVQPNSFLLAQDPMNTKANETIDSDTIELARILLAQPELNNYLNNVAKTMIEKLGGEDKLYEAILAAAAAAKHQAGGAPGDEEEGENPQPPSSVLSPTTVFRNILDIIGRTRFRIPEGRLDRIMLVCLIFMMFMQAVGARVIRSRIRTPALDNMLNPYDPDRPGEVWSFWNALFALFGYGPGAWGPDPNFHGPPRH